MTTWERPIKIMRQYGPADSPVAIQTGPDIIYNERNEPVVLPDDTYGDIGDTGKVWARAATSDFPQERINALKTLIEVAKRDLDKAQAEMFDQTRCGDPGPDGITCYKDQGHDGHHEAIAKNDPRAYEVWGNDAQQKPKWREAVNQVSTDDNLYLDGPALPNVLGLISDLTYERPANSLYTAQLLARIIHIAERVVGDNWQALPQEAGDHEDGKPCNLKCLLDTVPDLQTKEAFRPLSNRAANWLQALTDGDA